MGEGPGVGDGVGEGPGVGDGVGECVGVMTTVELPEAVKTGVIDTPGKTLEVCPTGMESD